MKKERLIAFMDAVLAIIMTILVLELKRPETATVQAFLDLKWNYFAYALSFFWLGSLWMGMNGIWEKAEYIDNHTIMWSLILLFLASFIPYSTDLVSENFNSPVMQGFYGLNVILMTMANSHLHKVLEKPNRNLEDLVKAAEDYRRMLMPDIIIKIIGFFIAVFFWPPCMMLAVLVAAIYIFFNRSRGLPHA